MKNGTVPEVEGERHTLQVSFAVADFLKPSKVSFVVANFLIISSDQNHCCFPIQHASMEMFQISSSLGAEALGKFTCKAESNLGSVVETTTVTGVLHNPKSTSKYPDSRITLKFIEVPFKPFK